METKRVTRRKHSKEFRVEVIQSCRKPGASVAAIALRSGLNANVVYRWLREAARGCARLHETQYVPYLAHIDPSGIGHAHSSKAVEATRMGWGNMRNVTRCRT